MSTQLATRKTEERSHHLQRLTADGTLVEFLASPDEAGTDICLIRGTIPPGVAVPLHSHPDVELFYVLEGAVEAFQSNGSPRWKTVGAGAVAAIAGNVKHAWRNSSPRPVTMVIVTTAKMYRFFHEVAKPFAADHSAAPPTPGEMQELFRAAVRYGYWMGSPEENRAIGLNIG